MNHIFLSLDDAYKWIIDAILSQGQSIAPRGVATTELRAVSVSILDPRRRYVSLPPRHWSFAYALGELCWHLRGSNRVDEIGFYSSRWREMSEDGLTIPGSSYGAKIFSPLPAGDTQWLLIKEVLQSDPASRRAILSFFDESHRSLPNARDSNCATSLQFLVRERRLEAIATMRSNDVVLGLPYDVFLFTMLQEMMAVELKLELGPYHHFVGSLHIYNRALQWSREIVDADSTIREPMPRMPSTIGIDELIKGEQRTRDPNNDGRVESQSSGYWTELLRVLAFCNNARLGKAKENAPSPDLGIYRDLLALKAEIPRSRAVNLR